MPVVGHHAVGEYGNPRPVKSDGFFQPALESLIVGSDAEQPSALRRTVHDVVHVAIDLIAPSTGHIASPAIVVPSERGAFPRAQ